MELMLETQDRFLVDILDEVKEEISSMLIVKGIEETTKRIGSSKWSGVKHHRRKK